MKNLFAYEKDQDRTLEEIYNSKKALISLDNITTYEVKTVVKGKYSEIIKRYSYYIDNKNMLEDIDKSPCNELEKKAMIHCYENSTIPLSVLKKGIKLNQPRALRSICTYCGINNPNTHDHYLPKSEYPEYSVYGPNLIPCCSECNGKKGERWKSISNKRFFFNAYYDEIPEIQVIESIITIEDNEPKIRFEFVKDNINFRYKELTNSFIVENHYKKLDLLNRFRDCCNSYIDEIVNSLIAHKKFNEEAIRDFLSEEYEGITETYGINNWKSITLKGMLDSSDFISYCSAL